MTHPQRTLDPFSFSYSLGSHPPHNRTKKQLLDAAPLSDVPPSTPNPLDAHHSLRDPHQLVLDRTAYPVLIRLGGVSVTSLLFRCGLGHALVHSYYDYLIFILHSMHAHM